MTSSSFRPPPGQPAAANDVVPAAITFAALGLDVSQAEVTACFLLPDGSELVPRWTLPTSLPGAQSLAERVQMLAKAQAITQLGIGLEATGLYWWHLACFRNRNTSAHAGPSDGLRVQSRLGARTQAGLC
jgi:hypothetical protein